MKFIYLTIFLMFAYAVYVNFLLWAREEYLREQKVAQTCLVFFLPLVGPIVVHGMIREFDRVPKKKNPNDGQGVDGMPGGIQ